MYFIELANIGIILDSAKLFFNSVPAHSRASHHLNAPVIDFIPKYFLQNYKFFKLQG
jgi:hypothetical protein